MNETFRLSETFVVLDRDQGASPIAVDPSFWSKIDDIASLQTGRLLGAFAVRGEGRSGWEMHPAGEELIFLLDGAMDLILEDVGGERAIQLRGPGAACIVPRGLWHCQHVHLRCSFGFITPGAGTEHR